MGRWLILTLIAAFCFGAGAAMQKHGMAAEFPKLGLRDFLKKWRQVVRALAANKLWVLGFLMGPIGGIFYFQALSEGKVTVILPLMNLGMLVTVLAGVLVLKERLRLLEWAAITVLLGGAVLLSMMPGEMADVPVNFLRLWILTGVICGIGALLIIALMLSKDRVSIELVMASLAGFSFGLGVIFIKIVTYEAGRQFGGFHVLDWRQWLWILGNLAIWLMLVTEVVGFFFFQAALSHGRVALVSPITTITSVVIPVIAGALVFGESIGLFQGFGITVVIIGTGMLAARDEKSLAAQPD